MKSISFLSIITLFLIICSCNTPNKNNSDDSDSKKALLEAELKLLEREKKILEQEKINLENSKTPIDEQAKLIENNRVIKSRKDLDNSTNNDYYSDAQSIISNFLSAENSRDFSYIYSFYSPSLRRYFGLFSPTYSSLENVYQKAWNATPYSKNSFISIDPINGNEFIVKINYQWSKNSNPSKVNSKFDNLKFVLDNDNKIIEVSSLN